ncbi:MAG: hypothetical protein IIB60_02955 [Planctomycetes bacterium]|nr:hypothetical protein [Planctomycetota bacterium]
MVGIGSGFFVQHPGNSKRRILHPAKLVGVQGDVYTAELEESELFLESGQEILVYYERSREFMQQAARIDVVDETDPNFIIRLTTTGEPVSAESRQHYRVSTIMLGLSAQFGPESSCAVLDVSATGFSVIAAKHYGIGTLVNTSIEHEGQTCIGNVSVQSVRPLEKGWIRYGLHCADAKKSDDNLAEGLQQLSIQVQREQLRRLACTS